LETYIDSLTTPPNPNPSWKSKTSSGRFTDPSDPTNNQQDRWQSNVGSSTYMGSGGPLTLSNNQDFWQSNSMSTSTDSGGSHLHFESSNNQEEIDPNLDSSSTTIRSSFSSYPTNNHQEQIDPNLDFWQSSLNSVSISTNSEGSHVHVGLSNNPQTNQEEIDPNLDFWQSNINSASYSTDLGGLSNSQTNYQETMDFDLDVWQSIVDSSTPTSFGGSHILPIPPINQQEDSWHIVNSSSTSTEFGDPFALGSSFNDSIGHLFNMKDEMSLNESFNNSQFDSTYDFLQSYINPSGRPTTMSNDSKPILSPGWIVSFDPFNNSTSTNPNKTHVFVSNSTFDQDEQIQSPFHLDIDVDFWNGFLASGNWTLLPMEQHTIGELICIVLNV
jgi:hypothetical protein